MGTMESKPDYGEGHTIRGGKSVLWWMEYPTYDLKWRESVRQSAAAADAWDNADQEFAPATMKLLTSDGDEVVDMSGGYIPAVRQI